MTATAPIDQADVLEIVKPTGYRLLVRVMPVEEKTRGGVYLTAQAREAEEVAQCVGIVLAMGEAAYQDKEKFPGDPWCKVGDAIVMRQYSGTRFKIDDVEHRLINDDTVEAVVGDPDRVRRV